MWPDNQDPLQPDQNAPAASPQEVDAISSLQGTQLPAWTSSDDTNFGLDMPAAPEWADASGLDLDFDLLLDSANLPSATLPAGPSTQLPPTPQIAADFPNQDSQDSQDATPALEEPAWLSAPIFADDTETPEDLPATLPLWLNAADAESTSQQELPLSAPADSADAALSFEDLSLANFASFASENQAEQTFEEPLLPELPVWLENETVPESADEILPQLELNSFLAPDQAAPAEASLADWPTLHWEQATAEAVAEPIATSATLPSLDPDPSVTIFTSAPPTAQENEPKPLEPEASPLPQQPSFPALASLESPVLAPANLPAIAASTALPLAVNPVAANLQESQPALLPEPQQEEANAELLLPSIAAVGAASFSALAVVTGHQNETEDEFLIINDQLQPLAAVAQQDAKVNIASQDANAAGFPSSAPAIQSHITPPEGPRNLPPGRLNKFGNTPTPAGQNRLGGDPGQPTPSPNSAVPALQVPLRNVDLAADLSALVLGGELQAESEPVELPQFEDSLADPTWLAGFEAASLDENALETTDADAAEFFTVEDVVRTTESSTSAVLPADNTVSFTPNALTAPTEQPDAQLLHAVRAMDAELTTHAPATEAELPVETNLTRHVVFLIAGTRYAIPVSEVMEMATVPRITQLPNVPDFVRGITNLRGEVLAVVDLRQFLQLGSNSDPYRERMLVVKAPGSEACAGFIVDSVRGLARVGVKRLSTSALTQEDRVTSFLDGVCEFEDQILHVLHVAKLFHSPEMAALAAR